MNNVKKTHTMNNIAHTLRGLALMALLLPLLTQPACAQQDQKRITVKSFSQDKQALTAGEGSKYSRTDGDGRLYAIVKMKSNAGDDLTAYTFNFGQSNHIVDGVHDDGQLWIYVQRNAKFLTIKREGYTSVAQYELGAGIEEGCTYELRISVQAQKVKKRSLLFEVTPPDVQATVKVKREDTNDEYTIWGRVDANGRKSQIIETGVWVYEVTAANYQPSTGRVVLTEGSGPQREPVALLPAYGFIRVENPDGITEAEIYVDDNFIGYTPYTNDKSWSIGRHRIVVKKGEFYSDYADTFTIEPGKTTRLKPELKANFAQTTITVDAPVDIYIDGERVGNRTWSGPLRAGTYTVECRQDKHRASTRQITVRQGVSETFTIDPPTPITGMLFVNTDPVGATVTIDGRQRGTTPFDDQQLLIGQHALLLTMKGYEQVSQTIDIDDGAVEQLDITMKQVITPKMLKEIEKREKEKRDSLEKARRDSLKLVEKALDDSLKLARKAQQPHKSYETHESYETYTPQPSRQKGLGGSVMAGLQAGTFMGLDLGAGLRIGSIAIEAAYTLGFSKSDAIYWNYDTDTTPEEAVYKPSALALRLGYAIPMGSLSLTPQVGARLLMVSSESGNSKCSATSATIGLRADYRLAKAVSLFAAPEMAFALSKSSIYEQVADVASDVKGWGTGFNARIGISINF